MGEIIAHGFPLERGRLIHALVGGSHLHGMKLEGKHDHKIILGKWMTKEYTLG